MNIFHRNMCKFQIFAADIGLMRAQTCGCTRLVSEMVSVRDICELSCVGFGVRQRGSCVGAIDKREHK